MKSVTITLGEKEYTVTQLPLRKNVEWQRKVAQHLRELIQVLPPLMTALQPILSQPQGKSWLDALDNQNMPALTNAGGDLLISAIDAMPVMFDLVLDFDPALRLDGEHIENEATEEEVIAAFSEICKMSFPFGSKWAEMLRGLTAVSTAAQATGSATAPTLPSSPALSGDSGMTS